MKKFVTFLIVGLALLTTSPKVQAADLYANSLLSSSLFDVISPQNSIGEPDQLYTDFRDEETYIKLDMGEGEEGRDGLTLFILPLNYGATTRVTFYNTDNVVIGSVTEEFDVGTVEWTATLSSLEAFRFVKIESTEVEQWRLDAVQATAISTPVVEEPVVEEVQDDVAVIDEVVVDDIGDDLASNTLIKLETSDSVYVLGDDGKRHPFPNEITFFSWGYSFDNVETVTADVMASYLIGDSVTIKPGAYLVKLQSLAKVYAVAPNHTLRWLYSEEVAGEIYGESWANEVVDVSDAFWPDYVVGELINSIEDVEGWETETQPF